MTFSPALTRFATALSLRRRPLLVALLALLHLVLLLGPADALARTLFVVHLGLFILWQPFVRAELRLSLPALLVLFLTVAACAVWLNGWMLALWIGVLAGIVGGKVFLFEARWSRLFYLLALAYLVMALLLLALPAAVPGGDDIGEAGRLLGRWSPLAVFAAMGLLPAMREGDAQAEVVDFVYSVVVVLLLAVLALGSLALMLLLGHAYLEALLESLLVIGLTLLVLGWVWNPHAGVAGIGTMFSRYLLSVGLPVERWLHTLADLAQRQEDPDTFVAEACHDMVRRLPWVTGGEWAGEATGGHFGTPRGRRSEFRFEALSIAIYTRYPLSPSLVWHFNLLAQLIAEFYADKLRGRQLKRLSYVQAIHETGARLTHDVKNLLQTLRTLCSAAEGEGTEVSPEFAALLRRQLPAIATRLTQTLEKLNQPRWEGDLGVPAARWWEELRQRHAAVPVQFVLDQPLPDGTTLPAGLFNHVAENLLANALDKRRAEPGLEVTVGLRAGAAGAELDVCDNGAAIPPALAADLLRGPVASNSGLGIGLYQAARLAELSAYRLSLAVNEAGRVCFRLAPAA